MKERLQALWQELDARKNHDLRMVVGMDGFIDEILHLVDKRQNIKQFDRVPTLKMYGEMITRAAGLSTNVEIVPVEVRLGGNGPYMSNALLSYGVKLTYIGALGNPIHPVYQDFAAKAEKVYSLCEPGHNQALEFDDGKLMMLKPEVFTGITWQRVKELVGPPKEIAALIDKCDLLGLIDWSIVFNMTDIWQNLIDEVLPLMADRPVKPLAFFDLSDPEKRTKEDILHGMKQLAMFESKFRAILGLNEKELYQIADTFDIKADNLKDTITALSKKLNIYCLMVHPVKDAHCVIDNTYYQVDGPYCEKPLTTTGAGDNFNAGFCLAQALGLDPTASLTMGVCSSGYYVRNAKSGTYEQVMDFAKTWAEDGKI